MKELVSAYDAYMQSKAHAEAIRNAEQEEAQCTSALEAIAKSIQESIRAGKMTTAYSGILPPKGRKHLTDLGYEMCKPWPTQADGSAYYVICWSKEEDIEC